MYICLLILSYILRLLILIFFLLLCGDLSSSKNISNVCNNVISPQCKECYCYISLNMSQNINGAAQNVVK